MTAVERIARWLVQNRGRYCDDCLAREVGLAHRGQANRAARTLATTANYLREKGTCAICGAFKQVTAAV
jgi:hypothetical protein